MFKPLDNISNLIAEAGNLTPDQRSLLSEAVKLIDRELTIVNFKLERTEKVKRTTGILLEETIGELEKKRSDIEETNKALQESMQELRSAQAKLIQSEKMASLGELTAGIAHEIQNPLNFVNNFSELCQELLEEMNEELKTGNLKEAGQIVDVLIQNLEKINHHGKRADAIVRGMLQHSSTRSALPESIDLNKLCEEYLRLCFHGLRAKDKGFNATIKTGYDPQTGTISLVAQDLGRALMNILHNAFYAVTEFKNSAAEGYEPTVTLETHRLAATVEIRISDNGPGIPEKIRDKIFQPFFTTKPTGMGTGLGLSLSYDTITKGHGGELLLQTKEGEGSTFIISLPV